MCWEWLRQNVVFQLVDSYSNFQLRFPVMTYVNGKAVNVIQGRWSEI